MMRHSLLGCLVSVVLLACNTPCVRAHALHFHDRDADAGGKGSAGHTCIQDSLWRAGEEPRIVPQDRQLHEGGAELRRRAARPQGMRIGLDFTFLMASNRQAAQYTCFEEGRYYVRGAVFVSPVQPCSTLTDEQMAIDLFCAEVCTVDDVLSAAKRTYLVQRLLPEAVAYFSTVLKVLSEDVVLLRPGEMAHCDARNIEVTIPTAYEAAVPFDMVLFVTASPTSIPGRGSYGSGDEKNVGFARFCAQNGALRPIAGVINIGMNAIAVDELSHGFQLSLVIHEMTHTLGFTRTMLEQLVAVPGTSFRMVSMTGVPYDTARKFVATPRVLEVVREHFNCSSMPGAQLEDGYGFGGDGGGTALSHWEKRLFMNEYMTGIGSGGVAIRSKLTLALLEDLGFYYPDYAKAETLLFGRNLGCGFALEKCTGKAWVAPWEDNTAREAKVLQTSYSPYFCVETNENVCTFDRTARGLCGTMQFLKIGPDFQYFSSGAVGGASELADFCPYVRAYASQWTRPRY